MSFLLTNGFVHSPTDPYATALLIDDGVVQWLGSDDTAEHLYGEDHQIEVIDLNGALVTPALVDSLNLSQQGSDLSSLSATDLAQRGEYLTTRVSTVITPPHFPTLSYATDLHKAGNRYVQPGTSQKEIRSALTHSGQLLLHPAPGEIDMILDTLIEGTATPTPGHRLVIDQPLDHQHIQTLLRARASVTVIPQIDDAGQVTITAPVASLLSEGVLVVLGSGLNLDGLWPGIRALLTHPDPEQRVSARAGFNAVSRTASRVVPSDLAHQVMLASRLQPGATATLAIWDAEQLSVQAPDGRVAAWSTDARAGTPLLPVLDATTSLPTCLALLHGGDFQFRNL